MHFKLLTESKAAGSKFIDIASLESCMQMNILLLYVQQKCNRFMLQYDLYARVKYIIMTGGYHKQKELYDMMRYDNIVWLNYV